MTNEFRIREVTVGLTTDTISTKFYPEKLISRKIIPAWKFWVKEKKVEVWDSFYQQNDNYIKTGKPPIGNYFNNAVIISFDSLNEAKEWIENVYKIYFQKKMNLLIQKWENIAGADMAADKIHYIN